jgi:hypothetical protein
MKIRQAREKTGLEKMDMPCPFGQLMDAKEEIKRLKKLLRKKGGK